MLFTPSTVLYVARHRLITRIALKTPYPVFGCKAQTYNPNSPITHPQCSLYLWVGSKAGEAEELKEKAYTIAEVIITIIIIGDG